MKTNIDNNLLENTMGKFYFSNTYYNSLDFIYKYVKEVLLEELTGIPKSYFKKIFTNIEDHRFAKEDSISNNSLYNNVYPMLGIAVTQDFSGPGNRTKMHSSHRLHVLPSEVSIPTIFHENNISIQLGSNIYKYNINLNAKFDTSFAASNYISTIYNTIHVGKHYYPEYSEVKYRIDSELYKYLRTLYKSRYEKDEDFLNFLNMYTNKKIVREFDRATGNIDYFILLPVRPLALINPPSQTDMNTAGLRESTVNISIDLEIELPNTLYFSAPMPLLRAMDVKVYEGIILKDENEPEIIQEKKEQLKDKAFELVRPEKVDNDSKPMKLVTMPKVDTKRIEEVHKKELKYSSTLSISEITDLLIIEDPLIVKYINQTNKNILKIFDEDGNEILPREVKIFKDSIDIILDGSVEDTILLVSVYGS